MATGLNCWGSSMKGESKSSFMQGHRRIVQYKTAYYSFYLPVACALLMAGEDLDNHVNVLIDMGIYFQVQDDYLDCFGEPEKIGKVNMDLKVSTNLETLFTWNPK
ncbi:hypothetical protein ACP275_08G067300 [Erythranthe tilingii]